MIFFSYILIFILIVLFFYSIYLSKLIFNKKFFKAKKFKTFNKRNLNNWMDLTKKERYNLSEKESTTYMKKRKVLLTEIRKEYERISKRNTEKFK